MTLTPPYPRQCLKIHPTPYPSATHTHTLPTPPHFLLYHTLQTNTMNIKPHSAIFHAPALHLQSPHYTTPHPPLAINTDFVKGFADSHHIYRDIRLQGVVLSSRLDPVKGPFYFQSEAPSLNPHALNTKSFNLYTPPHGYPQT